MKGKPIFLLRPGGFLPPLLGLHKTLGADWLSPRGCGEWKMQKRNCIWHFLACHLPPAWEAARNKQLSSLTGECGKEERWEKRRGEFGGGMDSSQHSLRSWTADLPRPACYRISCTTIVVYDPLRRRHPKPPFGHPPKSQFMASVP